MKAYCATMLLLMFVGCRKTYKCLKESLIPVFIGYTPTEIDSVLIRRFKNGSNFSQPVDSFLFTTANTSFERKGDSTRIAQISFGYNLTDEHDYQVVNPFDGRTVSIADAKYEIREESTSAIFDIRGSTCRSPLISYRRDGSLESRNKDEKEANVFIRK